MIKPSQAFNSTIHPAILFLKAKFLDLIWNINTFVSVCNYNIGDPTERISSSTSSTAWCVCNEAFGSSVVSRASRSIEKWSLKSLGHGSESGVYGGGTQGGHVESVCFLWSRSVSCWQKEQIHSIAMTGPPLWQRHRTPFTGFFMIPAGEGI